MKDKISKIISVLKKDGIVNTLKKVYKYFIAEYGNKINIFSFLYYKINKKKYENLVEQILKGNFERIIVWKSDFGWNVPLFQRPQHIAKNLAKKNSLVFYEVTTRTDKVKDLQKIDDNLYLVNFNNKIIEDIIMKKILSFDKSKYIQFYSTDFRIKLKTLKEYVNSGFKVIYEYIDDISPVIVGTNETPKNMLDKYNYMLEDKENVFVIVTADRLEKDVIEKRGKEKLAFSCNGVDYEHFANIDTGFIFDKDFEKILKMKKPIIGYYGALASWMDYELVKYLAKNRPNYNIVFFGVKYDDSLEKSKILDCSNVFFLGKRDYKILKNYANKFDVCTIPFKINDITRATSPVKLFEYMALGKPIVTTQMDECKKYNSVMIANNEKEFLDLIDTALNKNNNEDYLELLKQEAIENTWNKKADIIIDLLSNYE